MSADFVTLPRLRSFLLLSKLAMSIHEERACSGELSPSYLTYKTQKR